MLPSPDSSSESRPVVVIGCDGFIGRRLLAHVGRHHRTIGISRDRSAREALDSVDGIEAFLRAHRPTAVLNVAGYGGFPDETDAERVHEVNVALPTRWLRALSRIGRDTVFLNAGSSSEYGARAAGPSEDTPPSPHCEYALAKAQASAIVSFYGKRHSVPCATLRLYSVYGPGEPPSRLIPTLLAAAKDRRFPPLASADTCRDFVHVDDVCEAFRLAARRLPRDAFGSAFNIGTGIPTRLDALVRLVAGLTPIDEPPRFGSYPARAWDVTPWYSDPRRAAAVLGWRATIPLRDGLQALLKEPTADPIRTIGPAAGPRPLVSVVIAAYRDAAALPELCERLGAVFDALPARLEVIVVNDGSPDETSAVLRKITAADPRVIGVCHSRNFGSQAAFRSGLELARGDAIALMDGDLQDPPEVIAEFFARWTEGYDVVFGRRVTREEPLWLRGARHLFYRAFRWGAPIAPPLDAGDFSLMDRKVVSALLRCPERDPFWRALRAYVGFRQIGVDYHRPKRRHGRSSNSLLANLRWARRGFFALGERAADHLFYLNVLALVLAAAGIAHTMLSVRPLPVVTVALLAFCVVQSCASILTAERLESLFVEQKGRPRFIRRFRIAHGEIADWSDDGPAASSPADRAGISAEPVPGAPTATPTEA